MTETTTIQIHLDTKEMLDSLKLCDDESYDSVIKRLGKKTSKKVEA